MADERYVGITFFGFNSTTVCPLCAKYCGTAQNPTTMTVERKNGKLQNSRWWTNLHWNVTDADIARSGSLTSRLIGAIHYFNTNEDETMKSKTDLWQLSEKAVSPALLTLVQLVSMWVMWAHLLVACRTSQSPVRLPPLQPVTFNSFNTPHTRGPTSDLAVMDSTPGPGVIGHLGQLSLPSLQGG